MGLEDGINEGVHADDIKLAMKGHVKEGHKVTCLKNSLNQDLDVILRSSTTSDQMGAADPKNIHVSAPGGRLNKVVLQDMWDHLHSLVQCCQCLFRQLTRPVRPHVGRSGTAT